ncbi:hypothetical protein GCM10022243_41090 [Saccharothrix violaceirubra]|uniref:NlpC/P60 domain-containing protein n=1 Tax=Saccharothrix violaceirubra TaxID=413306 RepID=A0A7W7T898_9PSEU|nr:transglycosylase SLT domain-containing protein [Saccharothrix violaceirubra]MBB4968365.1 hypothetical protein [Saccharothrix violaceirubra]
MTVTGIDGIAARIQQLESLISGGVRTSQTSSTGFADALSSAMGAGTTSSGTTGADVVADAKKYLGVPYVWGGTDPSVGLDCSGLVQKVYGDLGVSLPRVSQDQAKVGTEVPSLDQAKPGDLIAFGDPAHHIGIYVGDGKMIHAPEPGANVRIQDVWETPSTIRRILPDSGTSSVSSASSGAGRYQALFDAATKKYNLPEGLLSAVAKAESNYDPNAVSSAGAQGLMQIMPATAAGLGVNPLDPTQAVDGAARLLSSNLQSFGSVPLALAAYNAGPGAVRQYGGIPPYAETQNYVSKIMASLGGAA